MFLFFPSTKRELSIKENMKGTFNMNTTYYLIIALLISFIKMWAKASQSNETVLLLLLRQLHVTLITSSVLGNNLIRHVGVKSFLLDRA